jgi:hypothetical protein
MNDALSLQATKKTQLRPPAKLVLPSQFNRDKIESI